MSNDLKWLPMTSAPRDGRDIVVRPSFGGLMIVSWWKSEMGDGSSGWWLDEGALYQDDVLIGWYPIPQDED